MIDLTFKYRPLIQLTIEHEYYKSSPARNLLIIPSEATNKLLDKLNLKLHGDESGFKILLDEQYKEALFDYLEGLEDKQLNFWILADSPYFKNLTDAADTSLRQIFFFSSSDTKDLDGCIRMHPEDYVSDLSNFTLSKAKIVLAKGESINALSKTYFYSNTEKNSLSLTLLPGAYQIEKAGKVERRIIVLENKRIKYPVGLVNISIDDKLKTKIETSLKKEVPLEQTDYKIRFKSRESFWRYTLIPRYIEMLDAVTIQSEEKNIKFSKPQKVVLNGGYEAYSFQSQVPLKWHEFSPYTFKLSGPNGSKNSNKVLIKRLPVPRIDNLITEKGKNQQLFISNIIFHL